MCVYIYLSYRNAALLDCAITSYLARKTRGREWRERIRGGGTGLGKIAIALLKVVGNEK
jgi:hypothetical protein